MLSLMAKEVADAEIGTVTRRQRQAEAEEANIIEAELLSEAEAEAEPLSQQ